jgi:hypothetical protein
MNSNLPEEVRFKTYLYFISLILVFFIFSMGLLFLNSCSFTDLFKTADNVFDDAIKVTVDKAAIQRDTDVSVNVEVTNKDVKETNNAFD